MIDKENIAKNVKLSVKEINDIVGELMGDREVSDNKEFWDFNKERAVNKIIEWHKSAITRMIPYLIGEQLTGGTDGSDQDGT